MGEYLQRDPSDPAYVAPSGGMTPEQAKAFAAMAGVSVAAKPVDPRLAMAQVIAGQTGKTVEEVLAFMGNPAVTAPAAPVAPVEDKVMLEPVNEATPSKVVVPVDQIPGDDKFIVTEIVNPEDATEADLKFLDDEEEEENDWSGKIRQGSKVKIVYQVAASRINWVGKKGKVVRIVGNEAAKVYDVEFSGGKIMKSRLNKKTGKIERGYEKKVIRNTFSEDQLELDN